jgi:hypothetical protein
LLASAVTATVQALHRGLHLEEIGAGGGPSLSPGSVVNDGENFHLLPPQLLQLFAELQTFQR